MRELLWNEGESGAEWRAHVFFSEPSPVTLFIVKKDGEFFRLEGFCVADYTERTEAFCSLDDVKLQADAYWEAFIEQVCFGPFSAAFAQLDLRARAKLDDGEWHQPTALGMLRHFAEVMTQLGIGTMKSPQQTELANALPDGLFVLGKGGAK